MILFVTTGHVENPRPIWTVELGLLLLHGRAVECTLMGKRFSLADRIGREATFQSIRYEMKTLGRELRIRGMEEIRQAFPPGEVDRLLECFPSFRMLSWAELRTLADDGVEIGSHGVCHEIHHEAQDAGTRRAELRDSKKEIEERLGRSCRFFAYPNGNHCAASREEVCAAGYEAAFTTECGEAYKSMDRFRVRRLSPSGSLTGMIRQIEALMDRGK